MKLKSWNVYYIIGLVPIKLINFILGIKLTSNKIWLSSMIGIIGIGVFIGIVKKFTVMPYPIASYGKLQPLSLDLPVECNALLFTSDIMDQHSFLSRTVEIITTIRRTDTYTIVVSPKLLREYGEEFTRCAVVREIKKYSSKSALKIFLLLVIPLEVLASEERFVVCSTGGEGRSESCFIQEWSHNNTDGYRSW